LAEHISHHPTCPTCSQRVLNNSVLSQHLVSHPQCGICGDRFADVDVLEKHEKNHADIEQAIRGESGTIVSNYQNPEIRDAITSIQSAPVVIKDDFIDGRKSAQLIHDVNPGFTMDNLEVGQDLDVSISSLLAQQNIKAQCNLCDKTFSSETVLDMHIHGAHAGGIQPAQNQESPKFQLEILENMINCNFCQESFISMPELNTHTAAVHREILEATQLVSAAQQVNSQEQVAVREIAPPFNCTLCKETFAKVGHLSKHININHNITKMESGKPFRCKICNSNFLQLSTLEKHHMVQHHGQEHSIDCPECSKTFKYPASLQQHLRTHSSVRLYQCGSCTRTFNWETSLRSHIKKCEGVPFNETVPARKRKVVEKPEVNIEVGLGAESLTVKCSRCGELFGDQDQFSEHTCPGDRGRGRRFRCGGCQLLFRSRRKIRRHLRSCESVVHQQVDKLEEFSGQRIGRRPKKVLKDDQFVSDFDGSDKELEDLVDSDAEEEFKVNEKEDYSESGDSEGSSDDEQDDFSTQPSVKSYMIERNTPASTKKTHSCNYCGRTFKAAHHLKEHIICHTGIYPFNCEECGKGFRRKPVLEKHSCSDPLQKKRRVSVIQETPGGGDRRSASPVLLTKKCQVYDCRICQMSFSTPQKYSNHLRVSPMCKDLTDKLNSGDDISEQLKELQDIEDSIIKSHLEDFNKSQAKFKCELCLFNADTEYKYKRHLVTKKHIENEEAKTEEETMDKLNNPRIYTCLICDKPFKDLVSLDEHVEEHKKSGSGDQEAEMISKSGRKIKPKKFYDDYASPGVLKRKAGEEIKDLKQVKKPRKSVGPENRHNTCPSEGLECGICGDKFSSHTVHFTHMLSHVPPEIVEKLPVVEGGGVVWCPHCPGPVQLEMVEQHMVELHWDMEEDDTELGLKIGDKKLEFDEIDPEELDALELPDSDRCVLKRLPG